MKVQPSQTKQRFEQQIEQSRKSFEDLVKAKFQKRKIEMNSIVDKKDLHFILNSFLKGDVFDEDILNQFWLSHYKQTAAVGDVVKVYVNGIIYVLDKIVETNIRVYELGKEREQYKQNHNFKGIGQANLEIEQLNVDLNQYTNDLAELTKPFDIDLTPMILKYKPHKTIGEEGDNDEDQIKILANAFRNYESDLIEEEKLKQLELDEQRPQEKYYRFVIYLLIVIFIGDLSLSFSKYNFVDLLCNILLFLNSLFEYYLLKDDPLNEKLGLLEINYTEGKVFVQEAPLRTTFNPNPLIKEPKVHSFERYTYSSLYLMCVAVLMDLLWVLLLKGSFYYKEGPFNPLILGESMWKYNHYVVYASIVMLIFKVVIILLLLQIVEIQGSKLLSRYHFTMNFVRFTDIDYLINLLNSNESA